MYTVIIQTSFTASHQIKFSSGFLEDLHYHNWQVEVAVGCEKLDEDGLGIDFNILKEQTDEIIAGFNGEKLENLEIFQKNNASAENVAKYIYQSLEKCITEKVQLEYVEVTEQPGCRVRYSEKT